MNTIKIHEPLFLYEGHQYHTPDGTELLSVTGICKSGLGLYQHKRISAAAQKGTHIHQACQYYDEKDLNEETLDPIIKPYLEQYKIACKEKRISVIQSEIRRYSPIYIFAGTIDKLARVDGRISIIDIKTGLKKENWWILQLGAYGELMKAEIEIEKYYALHLSEESYELIEFDGKKGFSWFLAFFASVKIKKELGYC